jgi:molecular chaperone DnaK
VSATFGIDLGTTNSVISYLVDGRPVPIPIDGSPIVPSIVMYGDHGAAVGREARNLELVHPEATIRSVKRRMGQEFLYQVNGRALRPEEVAAEILRALKRGAEAHTGAAVHDAVITVPAYFNDAQRRATLRAGELAGLKVLRLLNEPTSASLVYDQVAVTQSADSEVVLIYDLGGGTFDVSVLDVFEGIREVRATCGNSALGGDDFDEVLLRLFLDFLKTTHSVDPRDDPRAMARLRRLAEGTKIRLSAETSVTVREEFLTQHAGQPIHLELVVTRRQLEERIAPLLDSTIELAQRAVRDAGLQPEAITRICLVGGSTRIPLVRELLQRAFDCDIHEEIDVDLAVGLGAAVQAGLLAGQPVGRILVDVASHTLGVLAIGRDENPYEQEPDTFIPVLRRNTALPSERTEELYTMVDRQEAYRVEVFQGEAARVSQNTPVGDFLFPLEARPAGSPVAVKFAYDLNGVVRVSVSQPGTENQKTVVFKVADASATTAAPLTPLPSQNESAVERKARALLGQLTGPAHAELSALLARYQQSQSQPALRQAAEDELLDFLIDQDSSATDRG